MGLNDLSSKQLKFNYYSKINKNYYQKILVKVPEFKDFELPKYSDNRAWKRRFEVEQGKIVGNSFANYEEMRDYCYDQAGNEENYKHCDSQMGWCLACMRPKNG